MAVLQAIFRAFLNIAMIAMFLTSPAQAGTKSWQISESSGEVSVETGNSSSSASRGMLLQAGDAVATGASGRAVIVRGGEYVIVSPKSRVRITKPSETGAVVQIFQSVGSALFKIRKMETPHFGVKTPYLAAVVKGTTFNVTVTENGATVQVTEGRVEVSTLDGGASDMIVPGRIGRVDGNDKQLLKVLGTDEKSIRSTLPTTNSGSGKIEEKATTSGDTDSSSTKQTSDSDIGTQKGNASDASSDGAGLSNGATGSGFSGWISSAINSEPISLAVATAGLISGSQAIDSIAARAGSSAYSGGNSDNAGNANGNAGGNSGNAGNANGNAGGNSGNAGNGSGNAGGNSGNAGNANGNASGNSGNAGNGSGNAGGNSGNAGNGSGNAGGNSDNAGNANGNASGNSGNAGNGSGNAGGNSDNAGNSNGNAGGNSDGGGDDGNSAGNGKDGKPPRR